MAANDLALPPGHVLNEYRIESTLGIGGFGLTYLATDGNLNLRVALKEYLPGDLANRGDDSSVQPKSADTSETFNWGLDRFVDESRTLASFRHPNIVRVMRFFKANNTAYMVMEFVDGQALSDWARANRPVTELALRNVLLPLLDGLEVVHKSGFLHRDIKPGNIFIRDDGSPVLLDFGSARNASIGSELTAIVSPGYAPLEQYHSHGKQGPWSDIYALGGVLYWLVTGTRPLEAAARVRNDPMPPVIQSADHSRYSADLLTAIDWMLTPAEDQRPQTVGEIKAVLKSGEPTTDLTNPIDPSLTGAFNVAGGPATPPRPSVASAPSGPSGLSSMPTGMVLDRDQVKKVEAELMKHIGPIAPVVIRAAARKALSIQELAQAVAGEIDDDDIRKAFLKRYASDADRSRPTGPAGPAGLAGPAGPASGSTVVATALAEQRFDGQTLNKAEVALAQHLGPLARVVVKRAAMKARDVSELYLIIADEIDDKTERKNFIRKAITNK